MIPLKINDPSFLEEDVILRQVAENPETNITDINDSTLKKIKKFNETQTRFDSNRPITTENTKTKVIKICLENHRNSIAGVGAVLRGLRQANDKLNIDKIDSLHPLYTKDHEDAKEFEFQGVIHHKYNGEKVTSSVYRDKKNHEYVINPDPKYQKLFDLPNRTEVYGSFQGQSLVERNLYFGSAAAAFADQYRGKKANKTIDIIHIDSNSITGITIPLVSQTNEKRKQNSYPPVKTLYVMHGKLHEKMVVSGHLLEKLGHNTQYNGDVDVVDFGMEKADHVTFVSAAIASEALSNDHLLSYGHNRSLQGEGKVSSILNGIDADNFDITDEKNLGPFALTKTYDQNGIETTDYVTYRKNIKALLHEAGYIADPNLPLVLFIGRYASEKGVDILLDVIQNSKPDDQKVQFVTMGIDFGENGRVETLKKLQTTTHNQILRCYDKVEEQNRPFAKDGKEYKVTIKQLIRAASEMFIMPSHQEPCGLAAMEGQCAGSLLILPRNQGLKEIGKPANSDAVEDILQPNINAITYENHSNFNEAREAVKKAISLFEKMTPNETNILARKLQNEAMQNYNWVSISKQKITGPAVAYHELYSRLRDKPSLTQKSNIESIEGPKFVAPKQDPIIPIIHHSSPSSTRFSFFKRIALKISTWVASFFRLISNSLKTFSSKIKNTFSHKKTHNKKQTVGSFNAEPKTRNG